MNHLRLALIGTLVSSLSTDAKNEMEMEMVLELNK